MINNLYERKPLVVLFFTGLNNNNFDGADIIYDKYSTIIPICNMLGLEIDLPDEDKREFYMKCFSERRKLLIKSQSVT